MLQRTALCVCAFLLSPGLAGALTVPPALASLEESDREALERIARQPEPLRDATLRASQHVDVLVEIQRIQESSSDAFQARIEGLERPRQEQVWEIVREPGLLDELAGAVPRGAEELERSVARHPDVPAEAIREIGARYAPLLAEVQRIQRRADTRLEVLLADLPDSADRGAFRELVAQPELLSLLARRVELVVRLGDSYADDPATTRAHLAALGEEVAAEEARARDAWLESIAEDPEAAEELEASARAYAEENGVDYHALTEPEVRTRVEVVVHPYPYWFGYPHWYSDYYLYPYGYWYPYPLHFGFYHRHHHDPVWFAYPSPGFLFWFFSGHHHRHYTHLSLGFERHYRHYRRAHSHFHSTVSRWSHWRDRDHRHHGFRARHDGHRSRGSGGDGVFVSLFEGWRSETSESRHSRRETRRDRDPDLRRGERGERRDGVRGDRGHGWDGERRVVRPTPRERDLEARPRGDRDRRIERGGEGRPRDRAVPRQESVRRDPRSDQSRIRIRDHRSDARSSPDRRSSGRERGMRHSEPRRERGFSGRGGGRMPDVSSRGRGGGRPRAGRGGGDRRGGGHRGGPGHRRGGGRGRH